MGGWVGGTSVCSGDARLRASLPVGCSCKVLAGGLLCRGCGDIVSKVLLISVLLCSLSFS